MLCTRSRSTAAGCAAFPALDPHDMFFDNEVPHFAFLGKVLPSLSLPRIVSFPEVLDRGVSLHFVPEFLEICFPIGIAEGPAGMSRVVVDVVLSFPPPGEVLEA